MTTPNRFRLSLLTAAAALPFAGSVWAAPKDEPVVEIKTSLGTFEVRLDAQRAPISAANFLTYVKEGFYDGTIFHRVIDGFMVQGGGFTADMKQNRATHPAVVNEARGGLANKRGTIAMARTMDPHSATAQFFINLVDNDFLNYSAPVPSGWGYCVFGKVVEGMDVVDKIAAVATDWNDKPKTPVRMKTVELIEG